MTDAQVAELNLRVDLAGMGRGVPFKPDWTDLSFVLKTLEKWRQKSPETRWYGTRSAFKDEPPNGSLWEGDTEYCEAELPAALLVALRREQEGKQST